MATINLNPKDPSSPYFLNPNDGPGTLLTNHLLTADNYHSWARTIRRSLRIKKKLGFIDGTISQPSASSNLLESWLQCNDMVVTWIQNAMSLEIKNSVVYVETALALWLELEQRFAQNNGPWLYELKQSIDALSQGDDSVSLYFSKLKSLLDELVNFETIPTCTCGAMKTVIANQQCDWMMKFLMGLHDSFTNIKAQFILLKPSPSLSEVYALVQQEEKRKQLSNPPIPSDSLAFATRNHFTYNKDPTKQSGFPKRDRPFCTHCKISGHFLEKCFKANPNLEKPICTHCNLVGHTVDKCYKLHGYPPGHKLHNRIKLTDSFANQISISDQEQITNGTKHVLTQEQYHSLLALLQSQTPTPSAHQVSTHPSSSVISGIPLCLSTFNPSSLSSQIPWIIDTGATDHMICCTSLYTSEPTKISFYVKLPNGNQALVTHRGMVQLTPTIILKNVLCIPSLLLIFFQLES
ncbi:uncharacterized protein LOC109019046 [Juglans regia]|uniref:Uncharacterized protein LOC109019046 n=1 Tax=Juglans regia TaxID=51240 RepID=A0A2I4HL41_JUGRE|nr:uncharacterized protein LOC109019046 [Juglans regia]